MRFATQGAQKLRKLVGKGHLKGKIKVDQVYARYQHERMDLRHPHGGQSKYLWLTLVVGRSEFVNILRKSVLETGPTEGMKRVVEKQDKLLHRFAPVNFNNLRNSGNPRVYDNGRKVYDRPARQPRMSEAQLRAQRNRRGGHGGGLGDVT